MKNLVVFCKKCFTFILPHINAMLCYDGNAPLRFSTQ